MKRLYCALALVISLACGQANALDPQVSVPGKHFEQREGESLFKAICQGCHMAQGQGAQGAGAYPALANNPRLSADAYPVFMVAQGQGGMPAFKGFLDDEQIAAVVTYIRTHNGNAFNEPVNMATVKALTGR
ncbi:MULTISPECIES: cytochrome c [Pseudomonas]|uniref:Cytochrome c6 n=1 Tax=Pseudomonas fluorescens TaxID=294 RepID=A0A5E7ULP4_PSEFL|nr:MULTISPECIES: cytochrome c [Pseudomonas]OPK07804.1 cytochrome C oxidase Cbb3 [Pseudomonas sp. VI4.1]VVQ12357.1 Cytochrome c6 [Pseudomonas fluorescens]